MKASLLKVIGNLASASAPRLKSLSNFFIKKKGVLSGQLLKLQHALIPEGTIER